jgi:Putative porin
MNTITKRAFAIAGAFALGATALKAQTDSALLDALVKKGVLSDREAGDIRATEAKDASVPASSKIAIADYVKQIKFYGDLRLRYEYLDETPQAGRPIAANTGTGYSKDNVLERYRYRLRTGVDVTFTDNFSGGFELESNTADDSANQSFGNGFSKAGINIGLVYMQWKPTDWLTLTGGKQRNPLYTTDLTWDPDINPEGGSEQLSFTFPFGGGGETVARDPKDVKDVKTLVTSEPSDMSLTVGFTAAQLIYADNQEYNTEATAETPNSAAGTAVNPTGVLNQANKRDVWQFVEQVPVQFNFNKSTFVKVAPGFDSYFSGGSSGIPSSFTNGTNGDTSFSANTLAFYGPNIANDLEVFQAPGEIDFKAFNLPFKVYWDFDLNTEGKARVQDVLLGVNNVPGMAGTSTGARAIQKQNRDMGDNIAWLAGLQVGQNKKKGDWAVRSDFRQVGLGSIDPNENDSDWGDSFLNLQGVKVQASYNFTDFLVGTVSYYDCWNLKTGFLDGSSPGQGSGAGSIGNLPLAGGPGYAVGGATTNPGGANTGLGSLAGANTVQRLDVDLQWKF